MSAQATATREDAGPALRVLRTDVPVRVDGVLDDAAWNEADPIRLAYETSPGDNTPARLPATCYVAYDLENLFLGCEAEDPDVGGLRAFLTARDDIDGHDRIGFVLDPFNEARRGFEFVISPMGVQGDGVFDQQTGDVDTSWDAIWSSAGRVSGSGFTVEAAIPFESLRFPRAEAPQIWRMVVWRTRVRSEHVVTTSVRLDRSNSCYLCQGDLLAGFEGMSPGRSVQVTPTLTALRSDRRAELSSPGLTTGDAERDAGLDLHWSVTPDLSVDATVNPDFSQVEADIAQLDVNNRFALSYPEKRPFFLEGADFFTTPLQAVFTRTIADPVLGSKVTGKLGRSAVGAVVARDRLNTILVPGNQRSRTVTLDQDVTSVLARLRRDVGASSTVGALYTGRDAAGYHNRVVGVDGLIRPVDPLTIRFQLLGSSTAYPVDTAPEAGLSGETLRGTAFLAKANYESGGFRGEATLRRLTPSFRADAGFISQVDLRSVNVWLQRRWWGEAGSWYTRVNLTSGFWRDETLDGRLTQMVNWANLHYLGPGVWQVFLDFQRVRERFLEETYTLYHYRGEVSYEPAGSVRVGVEARTGDAIDLTNARKASWLLLSPTLALRLGRHFDVSASGSLERLGYRGAHVVTAFIPQLRATYNFTPRAFVRVVGQYGRTTRNTEAHLDPVNAEEKRLFTQVLFSYEVNAQTALFLGYEHTRRGLTDAFGGHVPLTTSARTFFVKVGYAWRP